MSESQFVCNVAPKEDREDVNLRKVAAKHKQMTKKGNWNMKESKKKDK